MRANHWQVTKNCHSIDTVLLLAFYHHSPLLSSQQRALAHAHMIGCVEPLSLSTLSIELRARCARLQPRLRLIARSQNFNWSELSHNGPTEQGHSDSSEVTQLWTFIISGTPLLDLLSLFQQSNVLSVATVPELSITYPTHTRDALERLDLVLEEYMQGLNMLRHRNLLSGELELGSITSVHILDGKPQAFGEVRDYYVDVYPLSYLKTLTGHQKHSFVGSGT